MKLTRRKFLYGLGIGASAPLLMPLLKNLSAETMDGTAKRFVIVVEGNGIEPHNFLSNATRQALLGSGADISAGDRVLNNKYVHTDPIMVGDSGLSTAPAFGSLAPIQQKAAVVLGLSSKIAGGGHTTGFGALSSAVGRSSVPGSATIDHVLGQMSTVRGETPIDVVRLGIHGRNAETNYETCALGAGRPAPIICNPTSAFNGFFGSVASAEGQATFRNRRELLDFASADVDIALNAFSGNSRERLKLERYLESLETLTAQHDRITSMSDILTANAPPEPTVSPLYASDNPLDQLEAHFEIATSALIGCLTNVVVIASGTGNRGFDVSYTSIDPNTAGRHSECHANDAPFLTAVTSRHVDFISTMAQRLDAVPEGNGTMLDHTVILYMSDNGEKHHSKAEEWPMLLVGGSELGMQTDGRSVVFPTLDEDNHRQVSNAFNTLGHAAGTDLNDFGKEGNNRIAEGPLTEIFS